MKLMEIFNGVIILILFILVFKFNNLIIDFRIFVKIICFDNLCKWMEFNN